MVAAAAAAAAVCALYMNCTVPTGECTFEYGRVGADGVLAPLSDLPKLNGGTEALNPGLKAVSSSTLFLPSATNGTGCCNPEVLTQIALDSGSEQQTTLLPPPAIKSSCGAYGCGLFQVAFDPTNSTFPLVAWLQKNAAPPPPMNDADAVGAPTRRPSAAETDPVVRLDPVTGLSEQVRSITTMPSGHLAPKGQGLGAFDPKTQTLYFPGSAGDLVDNRVFSISVSSGATAAPAVSSGPPKLDVNGMEWSAAADGGKGAPLALGVLVTAFGPMPTGLYQVVPQTPPIATPWKKIFDFGTSFDTMGNTAISADGRYFHALLKSTEVAKAGTVRVSTVDVVSGKEISSIPLRDPLQKVIDLVGC